MKKETRQKFVKILIVAVLLVAICLAIYLPLKLTGTLDKIDSPEKLKEVILSFSGYSYVIFFLLQFLQVTILPLPAFVTTVAGALLFGPYISSLLSFCAIFLGSLFAFFLGKKIGRKIVIWIIGEEQTKKWEEKLKRGNVIFFLMMLLPVFPDDVLCLVAGTVGMSYKFFIITNLITRPIAIISTCFLGSGHLIPFSGWGIPVWIAIIILLIIVFYLSFKYQPKIEKYVELLGEKITKRNKKNKDKKIENKTTENNNKKLEDCDDNKILEDDNDQLKNDTNSNNKSE